MEAAGGAENEGARVAALDRVLTRLALTSEANFQKVLNKLLPVVIAELNVDSKAVLQKVGPPHPPSPSALPPARPQISSKVHQEPLT